MEDNEPFSTGDAAAGALHEITQRCPGLSGAAVFQARALYNTIYKVNVVYSECYEESGERKALLLGAPIGNWQVNVYPNPASNSIFIKSTRKDEILTVTIRDLSGRTLVNKTVRANEFLANLEISLNNGAYLLSINSWGNESVTKMLLISK